MLSDSTPIASVREEPRRGVDFAAGTISFADVLAVVWNGKWILAAVVLACLAYAYVSEPGESYVASMRVVPAETDLSQTQTIGGGGGFLSGLGLGQRTLPKFQQFQKALASFGVAEMMEQRFGVLCMIYESECDQATKQWHLQPGAMAAVRRTIRSALGIQDNEGRRNAADLKAFLEGAITIVRDEGTLVLSFVDHRPDFAASFLGRLYQTTNEYLRVQDKQFLQQYIDYLAARRNTTTSLGSREAIQALLLEQERRLMLSEVDVPYAATALDPPTAYPRNQLVRRLVLWLVIGAALGIFLIFAVQYFVGRRGHGSVRRENA